MSQYLRNLIEGPKDNLKKYLVQVSTQQFVSDLQEYGNNCASEAIKFAKETGALDFENLTEEEFMKQNRLEISTRLMEACLKSGYQSLSSHEIEALPQRCVAMTDKLLNCLQTSLLNKD